SAVPSVPTRRSPDLAFARAALAVGAKVLENTPVIEARETGDGFAILAGGGSASDTIEIRSRLLFNCAGAWSDRFAGSFGEPVPRSEEHTSELKSREN